MDDYGYPDDSEDHDLELVREQLEGEREERQACYELLERCKRLLDEICPLPTCEGQRLVRAIEVRIAPRVGATKRKVAGA